MDNRKKHIRLTIKQKEEICKRYVSGVATLTLAHEFNVHRGTITALIKEHNIPFHGSIQKCKHKFSEETERSICNGYLLGEKIVFLAKKYGGSINLIHKILNRNNIKRKRRHENSAFTFEEEKEICNEYLNGRETVYQLANRKSVDRYVIRNVLKLNNIKTDRTRNKREIPKELKKKKGTGKKKPRLEEISEKLICNAFLNGTTITVLSGLYGFAQSTISKALRRNNIDTRMYQRTHFFNEAYFEDVITDEKAYWLGFLIADGGVTDKTVSITLKAYDWQHLEKFKSILGADYPLDFRERTSEKTGKKYVQCCLSLSSVKMVQDLSNFGIVKNKTFKTYMPTNIPDEVKPALCRGIIDGDGGLGCYKAKKSWYTEQWRVSLTGTWQLLTDFDAYMYDVLSLENPRTLTPHDNSFRISYGGNIQAYKVASFLYSNSTHNARLDRKYSLFLKQRKFHISSRYE